MIKRVILLSIILAVFSQLQLPISVASMDKQESGVYTLGEIVVRGKTEGVQAVQTIRELDADDIRESGARTVVEAIELLPGVDIFTGGSGEPRVNIRGLRTRHILLLLDGIPFNSAYDQQFDASLIPVEHIAKIKMTPGPGSVLYGQGGVGGVINVISKRGAKRARGMVGVEVGERDSYLGRAGVSGGDEKIDFFLSGSSYRRDAFPLSKDFEPTIQEDGGARENSDSEKKYFFTNMGFTPGEDLTLGLIFNFLEGEYGIPGGVIRDSADDFAPNPKYERIDNFEGFSFQVAGEYFPSDSFSVRSWVFMNQMEEEDNRYDSPSLYTWTSMYENKTKIKGLSIQPKYSLGEKGAITVGLSAQKERWEGKGKVKGDWVGWPPQLVILYPENKKNITIYSIAMEYEFSPIPELGLVLGYGHYFHDRDERREGDYNTLVGVHYDLTEMIRLKAAYQRNVRFPSLRQLYYNDAGNPGLKSERVYHYTAGTELRLPLNSIIKIDGFKSTARDFIEKDKADSLYENYDRYEFRGFELAVETRPFQELRLSGSYSYLKTKDLSVFGRDELQNRPEHMIKLQGKLDFSFGLSPHVSIRHVADQYYYSRRGASFRKAKSRDYTIVNLKLTQKLFNEQVDLYVGIDNVFDEYYEQSYGLPQAGRFVFGGVEIRF